MQEIELCNIRNRKPYGPLDVYCDRRSVLGNHVAVPGATHNEAARNISCDNYHEWFYSEVVTGKNRPAYEELVRLFKLYRKYGKLRIFCWCVPKRCHTTTIKEFLEEQIQKVKVSEKVTGR